MSNLDAYKRVVSVALSLSFAFGMTGCGAVKQEKVEGETEENIIKNITAEDITTEDITTDETAIKENGEEPIRAQDDFYGYVNKDMILSYDLSFNEMAAGSAYDIQNVVNNEIITMVEDISLSDEKYEEGSNEWTVKETYNQLISFFNQNTGSANQDFINFVEKVNTISDTSEALEALGYLKDEYGICDLFSFELTTDYRSSDKNALYIWQSNQYFDTQIKDIYENNVSKSFGKDGNINRVLNEASFVVKKGEFVSLMGASGSGKSTLLYLIGGLDREFDGSIKLDGQEIRNMKEKELSKFRLNKIGFVFQFYNLVQNLNVEDNILLPQTVKGKKKSELRSDLEEILKITGLTSKRKSMPSELSGGQQQRVAIARAVLARPEIILADEATGNLDTESGKEIMELFTRLNKEKKITILQVTHSAECASYSGRTINIENGRIVSYN